MGGKMYFKIHDLLISIPVGDCIRFYDNDSVCIFKENSLKTLILFLDVNFI